MNSHLRHHWQWTSSRLSHRLRIAYNSSRQSGPSCRITRQPPGDEEEGFGGVRAWRKGGGERGLCHLKARRHQQKLRKKTEVAQVLQVEKMRCWTPVVATLALLIAVADAKSKFIVFFF